jgi:transcription termination/antitermination protein NusA
MLDLKTMNAALEQLESDRGISKEKVISAIEDALAAAYKKDYGKRGQIINAKFNPEAGSTDFSQIKTVVDESTVRIIEEEREEGDEKSSIGNAEEEKKLEDSKESGDVEDEEEEKRPRYNPEHHLLIEDAKKIKKGAELGDELVFPLETKDDYGRIAAQTAKQVIIQRLREAERMSVTEEYEKRQGEIVSGTVQRIERGNVYVDLGRITGMLPSTEQIPGERYRTGERIQAYLYSVEETPRDITLRLSRSHPQFLHKLFGIEVPEIAGGTVEIKSIAREAGSRTKIAVVSNDEHIDPVGSCVGQRGVRVGTIMNELGGEKIDIIEWAEEPKLFIERSLSPAKTQSVNTDEEKHHAVVEVTPDQYSLAIGKGGQNARLAARLTGWKIDIRETTGASELKTSDDTKEVDEEEKEQVDTDAKNEDGKKEEVVKETKKIEDINTENEEVQKS